jgi:hypothetical protein
MGWSALAVPLARLAPVGPESPVAPVPAAAWLGWLVELALAIALLGLRHLPGGRRAGRWLLPAVAMLALYLGSRTLPYTSLTTPEAYFDLRPAPARLLAETAGQIPPGRFLSLSGAFFDPGDQAEIDSIYASQLPASARYDYTVAIKHKEILAPNLGMVHGLPAVDGFDGGILPLRRYSRLMGLILPEGQETRDGRLREYLQAVPPERWLDLFDARYVITDKVGDVWRDEVFYDLQFPVTLRPGQFADAYSFGYEADRLRLIAAGEPGTVFVAYTNKGDGFSQEPVLIGAGVWEVVFPRPIRPITIRLTAGDRQPWRVSGLTLLDERDGTFQPIVLGGYRMIHSGDVKIYERVGVARQRAFLVHNWQWQEDEASIHAAMADPEFDPREGVVLVGSGAPHSGQRPALADQVTIAEYTPHHVAVHTASESEAALVLADSFYPGWQARLDGRPATLYRADGLFRAVLVPAGAHEIIFDYVPRAFFAGIGLSAAGALLWLTLFVYQRRSYDRH